MKIRFECKLILIDEINNLSMDDIFSCDDVTKYLIHDLEQSLTSNGRAFVENANMTTEER